MNYDKLTKTLRQHGVSCVRAHGRYCSICDEASTALSTLQAENAQLRADLEYEREHANAYYEECGQWEAENENLRVEAEGMRSNWYKSVEEIKKLRAELEQVKNERDSAKATLHWLKLHGQKED